MDKVPNRVWRSSPPPVNPSTTRRCADLFLFHTAISHELLPCVGPKRGVLAKANRISLYRPVPGVVFFLLVILNSEILPSKAGQHPIQSWKNHITWLTQAGPCISLDACRSPKLDIYALRPPPLSFTMGQNSCKVSPDTSNHSRNKNSR